MSDASGANGALPAGTPGNRPAVLSLAIKEKAALYAAYMPFLRNGGIFVPTNRPYQLGDEVYLILTLMDDPTKLPVAGKVVWISPAGAGGRPGRYRRALPWRRNRRQRAPAHRRPARRRAEVAAPHAHHLNCPRSFAGRARLAR